jgi:RNase P subunit RPR2
MIHFLLGGPFGMCDCGYKEDVSHIGVTCLRCGTRARGPFIMRRKKLVFVGNYNESRRAKRPRRATGHD